jgi:hypothetical protein
MMNRVCAGLDIDTGATGTRMTLHFPLDAPAGGSTFG